MKLEVGKKYLTNDGSKVEVLAILEQPLIESNEVLCVKTFEGGHQTPDSYCINGVWLDGSVFENNIAEEVEAHNE